MTRARRIATNRLGSALLLLLVGAADAAAQAPAQTPVLIGGRNVNMAGGTQVLRTSPFEVRGDILGRAQNEPSCAISTRNPQHVLCGANDYRMVDVPGVAQSQIIRDAWLGEFQSADGGDTWESTLYGGFFLDPARHPLKTLGFTAAADPIVRSGPAGLTYYGGIAFTSDKSRSALHVTTCADLNHRELDAMPFKRVRTVIADVAEGVRFIDKPWISVEADAGGRTCTIDATAIDPEAPALAETLVGKKLSKWLAGKFPGWSGRKSARQRVPASIIHILCTVFLDRDDASQLFRQYVSEKDIIDETAPPHIRHTGDVRASFALPVAAPDFGPGTTKISDASSTSVTDGNLISTTRSTASASRRTPWP